MPLPSAAPIYFDNNATTHLLPEVQSALLEAATKGLGNPSSAHRGGAVARSLIREAREALARLLGCAADKLIFTSGATEANNTVLRSAIAHSTEQARIVTTVIEHSSVLMACEALEQDGVDVVYLPVNRDGVIDLERLDRATNKPTDLVSVQWVNNETGIIFPIAEVAELCRSKGIPLHIDSAQAVGKLPLDLDAAPIDFVSIAGHKFHAPQGIGVLYVREPGSMRPLLHGGDQEGGIRAGTENILGIVGLGCAAEMRHENLDHSIDRMSSLRDAFESAVMDAVPDIRVNGGNVPRACNCSNLLFEGVNGEALVARLDQVGIQCSQGSACTNQRPEPSYVLRAMGLTEDEAYSSVRFSFSVLNTPDEIDQAVKKIAALCESLRVFAL